MKKLFAIMLALMLVLTMGSALAQEVTEPTPSYVENGKTFTIAKTYDILNEGTTPPTETLELSVAPQGGAPALESVAYDADSKKFTVDLPMYTNVGEYIYVITEVDNKQGGVTYDTNTYYLKVTVAYKDDTYSKLVCYTALHTGSVDGNKADAITNTYEAGSLSISKAVTGNMGDKSKYFAFTVTLTGEEGKTYAENFAVTGGSNGSNPDSIAIGTPEIFYLHDGETITIANLPYGVSYTVVETPDDAYDTYINGSETASADGKAEGKVEAEETTVAYRNDNNNGTIDTGITTDNLPYIVLMGIVVLAGVAMIAKRRMAHND